MDVSLKNLATPIKRAACSNAACTNSNYVITWQSFSGTLLKGSYTTHSWWRHQMKTFFAFLALCPGNSPGTGEFLSQRQWREVLVFSLICAWIHGWVNNREAGDLRCHRTHYVVTMMLCISKCETLLRRMYFRIFLYHSSFRIIVHAVGGFFVFIQ